MPAIRSPLRPAIRSALRSPLDYNYGGGAPSLPAGAIGIWYADQYQATPRRAIPNAATTTAISQNLLTAPNRLVASGEWACASGTLTDASGYSTISAAGDFYLLPKVTTRPNLPAGQYTLYVEVMRDDVTDQQFAIYFPSALSGGQSGTFTATSSWQSFSWTATLPAAGVVSVYPVTSFDHVTGAKLRVRNVAMYAGASAIAEPVAAGHAIIDANHYSTASACSGGVYNPRAANSFGLIQFPANLSLTNCTVVAVARKVSSASYSVPLCATDYSAFAPMFDINTTTGFFYGGSTTTSRAAGTGSFDPIGEGYMARGWIYNGTQRSVFVNKTKLVQAKATDSETGSAPSTPVSVNDLRIGMFAGIDVGGYEFSSLVLYDRALSDTEYVQAVTALTARAAQSSLSITTANRFYVAVGDSNTVGVSSTSWARRFPTNASPKVKGAIYARFGKTLNDFVAECAALDTILPSNLDGNKYILSVFILTNNLDTTTPAADLALLASTLDARRAAGWLVVIHTILPVWYSDGARTINANANRATYNTEIRTWATASAAGTHADRLVDWAADPDIGPDAAAAAAVYYLDEVTYRFHLNNAGQAIAETYERPVVNSL